MSDLDELHPSKLAVNLFSKGLIDEDYFKSIHKSVKSTEKDEMVTITVEILQKIYDNLKADSGLCTPVHEVLKKLRPDSAKKFASEMSEYRNPTYRIAAIFWWGNKFGGLVVGLCNH